MLQMQHSGTRLLAYMTKSTSPARHVVAGTSTTYIEEADVDVEVNVHVIDSSIFSTEIQVRLIKGERREQRPGMEGELSLGPGKSGR